MASDDRIDPLAAAVVGAVRDSIKAQRLEVTRLDTKDLSDRIGTVNTKLNYALVGLVVLATLVISTYAAHAILSWRLMEVVVSAQK